LGYWKTGMMEYWVWRKEIFYIKDGTQLYIPILPFFHHSNIPFYLYWDAKTLWGEIKAKPSMPGFFT
jgi:hypothetical protein